MNPKKPAVTANESTNNKDEKEKDQKQHGMGATHFDQIGREPMFDEIDQTLFTIHAMSTLDNLLNHTSPCIIMRIFHRALKHKAFHMENDPRIKKKKKLMKHLNKLNGVVRDAANDMEKIEKKISSSMKDARTGR